MRRTREEVLQELERRKKLYFRNKRLRQRRLVQTMLPLSAALLLTVGIGLMGMNYRQQGITDGILGRPVQNAPNGGMISNYDRFYGLGDAEPVPEVSQDQKFDSPGDDEPSDSLPTFAGWSVRYPTMSDALDAYRSATYSEKLAVAILRLDRWVLPTHPTAERQDGVEIISLDEDGSIAAMVYRFEWSGNDYSVQITVGGSDPEELRKAAEELFPDSVVLLWSDELIVSAEGDKVQEFMEFSAQLDLEKVPLKKPINENIGKIE